MCQTVTVPASSAPMPRPASRPGGLARCRQLQHRGALAFAQPVNRTILPAREQARTVSQWIVQIDLPEPGNSLRSLRGREDADGISSFDSLQGELGARKNANRQFGSPTSAKPRVIEF